MGNTQKFQLHMSGMNTLAKCGEQFRRRYIDRERTRPGISAAIGTAVDTAVTADLAEKIATGQLLPLESIQSIAHDKIIEVMDDGGTNEGVRWDPAAKKDGIEAARGKSIDAAVTLATLYHEEVAPHVRPTHVQRPWTLDINGLPFQLCGTIDVQEGLEAIRDTKTSGKSPAADEAALSMQLTTYCMAVAVIDGEVPKRVHLDYLVRTKTPKLVQLESARTRESFAPLLERLGQTANVIQSGIFTPAPADAWWCSDDWCAFHDRCPYAVHPVSVAV